MQRNVYQAAIYQREETSVNSVIPWQMERSCDDFEKKKKITQSTNRTLLIIYYFACYQRLKIYLTFYLRRSFIEKLDTTHLRFF